MSVEGHTACSDDARSVLSPGLVLMLLRVPALVKVLYSIYQAIQAVRVPAKCAAECAAAKTGCNARFVPDSFCAAVMLSAQKGPAYVPIGPVTAAMFSRRQWSPEASRKPASCAFWRC